MGRKTFIQGKKVLPNLLNHYVEIPGRRLQLGMKRFNSGEEEKRLLPVQLGVTGRTWGCKGGKEKRFN